MTDLQTTARWEALREEMEMWQRATIRLADELVPKPHSVATLRAPWWWHEGLNHDPTEPEPRAGLLMSAILMELAFEAIKKDEVSEASTTLRAIKESGLLEELLTEQAAQLELAAENLRMKRTSLAGKQAR
jgi:hypothetical protein